MGLQDVYILREKNTPVYKSLNFNPVQVSVLVMAAGSQVIWRLMKYEDEYAPW
jgi:hypothetical protein